MLHISDKVLKTA